MNIQAKLIQYGIKNSFIRIIKFLFRIIGIKYEEYLYCVQEIPDLNNFHLKLPDSYELRETTINDYVNNSIIVFDQSKISLFKKRYETGDFKSYGIFKDDKLVYSCWISLKNLEIPGYWQDAILKPNEGLLISAICHPDFRGLGLHNQMNIFRLNQIKHFGKSHAVAVIQRENIPARKSQKKAGFKCSEIIRILNLYNKTFISRKFKTVELA